ncbi:MAG TPA: IS1634 family transposase [Streptosporangiaceae bacterium]|nr:IS1634 family transposase [Streptosporangiaceae bacterium]
MAGVAGKVHVVRVAKTGYVDKQGRRRDYSSAYLRRTYREGGKVKNETVANLSALPAHVIDLIDAGLKGKRLVPAGEVVTIARSVPHGHVAAAWAMAAKLGLPALLGPAGRERDLALALIVSRVVAPASKLATLTWWADTALGADLGAAETSTDAVYAAMDWLAARQDGIEAKLAARHLGEDANPPRMALFDLSSSWLEGSHCPLAARGYSRDGKKGRLQIEYGLLTDPEGRPVAVRVFPGDTGDPAAFTEIVSVVRGKFKLARMVMVGDRGMITKARIEALNTAEDATPLEGAEAYGWITALRAPAIKKLMAEGGPLQMSLFDQQGLAEITSPDYPGERLVACRNPVLAANRARKREDLLQATERLLAPIITRVQAGRLTGAAQIGVAAGKVINKYNTGKHFELTITDTSLAVARKHSQIAEEATLDGFYVLRTPVPERQLPAPAVVTAYKNLKYVERDFRHIKSDDLDLRPVFHRLEERVRSHVLICMLACYLTWHLRKAWAPLTFTDEHPPAPGNPVAAAQRSPAAQAKASRQRDEYGHPYHSFRGLLDHLATLTRNDVRFAGATTTVPMLAQPTTAQREAFDLIGAPIPLTLQ